MMSGSAARVDGQSGIAAVELHGVIGDKRPIAVANDGQEVPVLLRGETEVDDVHRLEAGGMRRRRKRHRQVLVDQEARAQIRRWSGRRRAP